MRITLSALLTAMLAACQPSHPAPVAPTLEAEPKGETETPPPMLTTPADIMAAFTDSSEANVTRIADGAYELLPPTDSQGRRLVRCSVTSEVRLTDEVFRDAYYGPCYFQAEGTGGFSIQRPGDTPLRGSVVLITLSKIDKTNADVRGLTTDGNNSRWGPATRSTIDAACWDGEDFQICANSL